MVLTLFARKGSTKGNHNVSVKEDNTVVREHAKRLYSLAEKYEQVKAKKHPVLVKPARCVLLLKYLEHFALLLICHSANLFAKFSDKPFVRDAS
ncbi:hypothetical protein AGMMS50229_13880 [Campylobacterota bacterium]|nr:hypothetical protein AGMMS50229_13880 [Campylobacterota bacterium]